MRFVLGLAAFIFTLNLSAQRVADFENYNLGPDEFLNGSDGLSLFESGNVSLRNTYDVGYDFWSGWAISSFTDTITPGFNNQYSAISGQGADNSTSYAISFASAPVTIGLNGSAAGGVVDGLWVNNSTYAYLSMKDGDSFAKKFGGETGDDQDYFLLSINKWLDDNLSSEEVLVYLADYRNIDNSNDYILKEWEWVDLSSLGNVDSLQLSLSSTDNGQFGMNTPAYFCIDNITTRDMTTSVDQVVNISEITLSPTLCSAYFKIYSHTEDIDKLVCFNQAGLIVRSEALQRNTRSTIIDCSDWSTGVYFIKVRLTNGEHVTKKISVIK